MKTKMIQEQIQMARGKAPKGWEAVVWRNRLSKRTKKVSYGFNFQPAGKIKVGDRFEDSWGGARQMQAVCEAVAVI